MNPPTSDNNTMPLSSKIKLVIIYLLKKFFLILSIYLLEKLIYIILLSILHFSFVAIPFQIFLHLLLIRYLVLQVVFAGLSFFISRNIQYERGKRQASVIYKELMVLKSSFILMFDEIKPVEELRHFNTLQRNIKNSDIIIKRFFEIFYRMKQKFNTLTYDQNIFYENISNLKNSLEKSQTLDFLNDVIKKLREEKVTNINDLSLKDKNEIIDKKKNIKKLIESNAFTNINNLIAQLSDYLGENINLLSYRYFRNFFSNLLFSSLHQYDIELSYYFIFQQKSLITKDGNKIDYIIINHNTGIKQKIKKLMIMCGPNADPYQIFARNLPIDIYLNKGIDVLCWNYRGYGFSTGKADFNNLREDVMDVYTEIQKNYNYEKIGVHGISLGGIPACYLAGNSKDIKLLVSDRNFGQIDYIAKNHYLGKYLLFLYKLLFMQNSRNVEDYLNANCTKIILNDPCDEIVTEGAALKTLISEKLCNEYIHAKTLNNDLVEMKNLESFDTLETNNNDNYIDNQIEIEDDDNNNSSTDISLNVNNKTNYNLIIQNIRNSNLISDNKRENGEILTILDILLSKEKNRFISSIIKISEFLKTEDVSKISIQPNIIGFIKEKISKILRNFTSSGDILYRICEINNSKYNQNLFIENFFNNLFIWGTYDKLDDYGSIYHSTEFIGMMIEKNIKDLNSFLKSETLNNYKSTEIISNINLFYNDLILVQKNMKFLLIKAGKEYVYLNDGEKYENELIKLGRGNLVSLFCGHNGQLSEEENIVFKYYLNKSDLFIFDDNGDINTSPNKIMAENYEDNKIDIEELDTSFSGLANQ